MNFRFRPSLFAVSLSALVLLGPALGAQAQPGRRQQGNPFKAPQATVHAPHPRTYHVRHLKLEFAIDGANHSAKGIVTHFLTPLENGLTTIVLDAGANLTVQGCKINGAEATFKHDGESLAITAPTPLSSTKEAVVEIRYEMPAGRQGGGANGAGGFTWIDPRPGDPTRRAGFWTQGETDTNHKWVPCYDWPNDKCTSETHTTVPEEWTVIGNGSELPVTSDPAKHAKTYHWVMKQPHSTYLLSLAGGEMDVEKTQWAGIPLYYAVPKGMGALANSSFGHTPDMLSFFSKRFGYKYPWPKYAQVCAFDFPGGMENVSATTLGPPQGTLIDARLSHRNTDSLISHELGHQWFGDLVTCSDWGDVWLNEGFATFCAMLYTEHAEGKDAYEQDRMGAMNGYMFEARRYKRPLSTNLYTTGDVMFGQGQTYSRGGLVLHMLRRELGDNVFFGGLSRYLKANAYKPVASSDLIKSMSEAAGKNLTPWFDQWVFKPGHPVVDWSWTYDAAGKYTVLHLKQTQETTEGTPIYSLPLRVAVIMPRTGAAKPPVVETTVTFDKADQEIRLPGSIKPESVLIDPGHDLLMEDKSLGPADAELAAQLRYAPSYQDRLRAARRLAAGSTGKDAATVQMLADALAVETSDSAAAGMIRLLSDLKKESLRPVFRAQAASKNPLRRAVGITALAALPLNAQDVILLRQTALSDTEQYTVVEMALSGLGRLDTAGNMDVFQHQVEVKSTRDRLATAVVGILTDANLAAGVPVLLKAAAPGRQQFLRRSAIRAIGILAPGNPDVHTALIAALKSDGQPLVQNAAIDALKSRKDMEALEALRAASTNDKDSSVRSSAQDAVTELTAK